MTLWCSNRLNDLLMTDTSRRNSKRTKETLFQDLFSVSSCDLQEQMILETIEAMTTSLEELQGALEDMRTYPRKLAMDDIIIRETDILDSIAGYDH
ncbi:hypothetical protein BG005_008855 [Podila minutissima]|nr:hypothetical protein BG005_008855 [Podila minutissima]